LQSLGRAEAAEHAHRVPVVEQARHEDAPERAGASGHEDSFHTGPLFAGVQAMQFSLVVPVYSEAGNICPLLNEIRRALDGMGITPEPADDGPGSESNDDE
jgi:hypothetical protein